MARKETSEKVLEGKWEKISQTLETLDFCKKRVSIFITFLAYEYGKEERGPYLQKLIAQRKSNDNHNPGTGSGAEPLFNRSGDTELEDTKLSPFAGSRSVAPLQIVVSPSAYAA